MLKYEQRSAGLSRFRSTRPRAPVNDSGWALVETNGLIEHDHTPRRALKPPTQPARRLRVLVFTLVFPNPQQPLHGTFVFERIRHLAAITDIHVVAPVPWFRPIRGNVDQPPIAPIISVRRPRFWYIPKLLPAFRAIFLFLSAIRDIRRLRASFDFDLIDAHFAYPDGFAAILLGLWFNRPVCITLRGTIVQWSRRPLGRWLCDWALRHAQQVIAVAQSLAERARQGGVPECRIETIANGVDTGRFRLRDQTSARKSLGLSEDGQILVSVGHISPRKGFHRVIRCLPRVLESCPQVRLAIVGGKGAEHDNSVELYALARDLGLTDRILFAGAQVPDRVALWLAAADAFVLASDFEGCPNVILEAMACGRPVVATRVGDIERMVPEFAGVLFDDAEDQLALAESLVAVLSRDWQAQQIHDHVAARSWDDVAQRVTARWLLAVENFDLQRTSGPSVSIQDVVAKTAQGRRA